ncbi:MAG: hypothetical protein JNK67_09415 [Alphaproteobacteria bacterium]|nr:hypothetical protein [Alphaproteobacteria bacterium]
MRSVAFARRGGARLGRLLALALVLGSATTAAGEEPVRRFEVVVKDGVVAREVRVLKVSQHDRVRIRWSVDRPLVVHLEGYDVSVTARPDAPQTMEFLARATGRFPVHAHAAETVRPEQGHAHGRGAVLRIEVHPR